jgi:hypothetical protein
LVDNHIVRTEDDLNAQFAMRFAKPEGLVPDMKHLKYLTVRL